MLRHLPVVAAVAALHEKTAAAAAPMQTGPEVCAAADNQQRHVHLGGLHRLAAAARHAQREGPQLQRKAVPTLRTLFHPHLPHPSSTPRCCVCLLPALMGVAFMILLHPPSVAPFKLCAALLKSTHTPGPPQVLLMPTIHCYRLLVLLIGATVLFTCALLLWCASLRCLSPARLFTASGRHHCIVTHPFIAVSCPACALASLCLPAVKRTPVVAAPSA